MTVLLFTLLPVSVLAQVTDVPYIECSWNGSEVTSTTNKIATATVVTANDTEWDSNITGGWYVVNSEITISNRVTVTGEVHLILADGCKLTASKGIDVSAGNSLTIYAQSEGDGMGALEATGDRGNAGIGGSFEKSGGMVTIHGGKVTAKSVTSEGREESGAGIGGGSGWGSGGTVTIYGGEVTANGNNGAGIGGGGHGSGGEVAIYGGTVTASSNSGAGIGGGNYDSGGEVAIYGGTVTASSNSGAGIGGGSFGSGGEVAIYGGTVTATGGYGAGIGGGSGYAGNLNAFNGGNGGTITISGGEVTASSDSGAGIGGGGIWVYAGNINAVNGGNGGTITISGGEVTASSDYGAGIGGGGFNVNGDITVNAVNGGDGGTITISGGTVTATGNGGGAGIGGGKGSNGLGAPGTFSTGDSGHAFIIASSDTGDAISDQSGNSNWSGVIFEEDEGAVYGQSVTLTTDATIPAGKTLEIKDGVTLAVKGTLTNNGRIVNYGTIDGEVTGGGTVAIPLTAEMIKFDEESFTYTGDAIKPEVTVLNEGVTYIKDTDYTVSYSDNNINAGSIVTVTVTPIDSDQSALLGAAVTKEFTIAKATATLSFAEKEVSAVMGGTVENTLTVDPEGVAVSYSSSDNGVATVDASTGTITLVGAGTTTITATITDGNYQGKAASYTLTVTRATLTIEAEGETTISVTRGSSLTLTAKASADELGANGAWTWMSGGMKIATVKSESFSSTSTSTATVTPVSVGTATITATYTDSKYTGSVTYTVTVTEPYVPEPEPEPSYFTLDFDDHPCEGVTLNSNLTAVEEGGTLYLYVEKEDETLYDYDNMRIYAKRGVNADWEELTEDPKRPGVYPIERIWSDIFIKVEGVTPKDPTAIAGVETLRIYATGDLLHVETPTRQRVTIVSMAGALIIDNEQEGVRIYRDLNAGIYIVRVGDYATKVRVE